MKVTALSDLHGYLPTNIEECDVVVIAGDILPLEVQEDDSLSQKWFLREFKEWLIKLPCKHAIIIGGNHDFMFEHVGQVGMRYLMKHMTDNFPNSNNEPLLPRNKLIYLIDDSIKIDGKIFYGCPWCTGPRGWAFIDENGNHYKEIPENIDVLICHQPPKVDKVGCSYPNTNKEREFGSDELRNTLLNKNPKILVCGHIHTGTHNGVKYNNSTIYNVSIKDEQYKIKYKPTIFEI